MWNSFCYEWPEELKDLQRECSRAQYRVKNLEANITRVTPEEFDAVMCSLEHAREQALKLVKEFEAAYRKYLLSTGDKETAK